MSKDIEQKVVEMQFENGQFERGVKQSLQSVENLKKGMDMSSVAKGISSSGMVEAIDKIADAVSLKGTFIRRTIENIANDVYQKGKQMLNSLTIEPINQGFEEYELKMGAVQTIMASTGEELETVNAYLEELNRYADRTIYSFSDMTQNIGKFTNAGVSLDKAVAAIQGVSNEAALSGANANEASRAMYNFAQALSSGAVRLIDWKSIENANMATVEFKQQLIDTAVELGMLTKEANGMYKTLDKKVEFNALSNFNDSLQKQWMTSSVLIDTLAKYSDETTDIGKRAYAAAQDVKTFTQLMDTLKEGAGSGWAQTWEILFGNFNEAKELWTGVSQVVGGFIDRSSEARNEVLQDWKDLGGRKILIQGITDVFESLRGVVLAVSKGFRHVFPEITAKRLLDVTGRFGALAKKLKEVLPYTLEYSQVTEKTGIENTRITDTYWQLGSTLTKVRRIFEGVASVVAIAGDGLKTVASLFVDLVKWALPGGGTLLDWLADLGDYLTNVRKDLTKTDFFGRWKQKVVDAFSSVGPILLSLKDSFASFFETIKKQFDESGISSKISQGLSTFFSDFIKAIPLVVQAISSFVQGSLNWIQTNETVQNGIKSIKEFLFGILDAAPALYQKAKDFLKGLLGYGEDTIKLSDVFSGLAESIKAFVDALIGFDEEGKSLLDGFLGDLFPSFKKTADEAKKNIADPTIEVAEKIPTALDVIKDALVKVAGKIHDAMVWIVQSLSEQDIGALISKVFKMWAFASVINLVESVSKTIKNAGEIFESISESIKNFFNVLGGSDVGRKKETLATALLKMAVAIGVVVAAVYVLSKMPADAFEPAAKRLGILAAALIGFGLAFKSISYGAGFKDLGAQILKMSIGIMIFVGAMWLIAKMSLEHLAQGLIGLGFLLTELSIFFKSLDGFSGNLKEAKLVTMAISILLMIQAVKSLAKMDFITMLKGLAGLGGLLFELQFFVRKVNGASVAGFFGLGVALLSLVKVMKEIAKMTGPDLVKSLGVLAVMFLELGVMSRLMSKKLTFANAASFVGIAVALLAMVRVMKKIAKMPMDQIAKSLGVIGVMLLEIGVFSRLMGKGMGIGKSIGFLISFAGSLGLFLLALQSVKNYDPQRLLSFGVSFGVMMAGMAALIYGLNVVTPAGVASALVSIGLIVGAIEAVGLALSAINDLTGGAVSAGLDGAAEMLQQLGFALGGFFGAIGGGVIEGLSLGLPGVGTNLSNFMTNAQGFFTGLEGITEEMLAGAGRLALMIAEIAGAEFLNGISSLINLGKDPVQLFVDQLAVLGPGLLKFSVFALGINESAVTGAANAASMIASMVGLLPPTGGIAGTIFGDKDLGTFSRALPGLGVNLLAFSVLAQGINTNAVTGAANAASVLAELNSKLPPTGGKLQQWITGEKNLRDFATNLPLLGFNIARFAGYLSKTSNADINKATNAAKMLGGFAQEIPSVSLLDRLNGTGLEKFTETLPTLGTNIAQFVNNFTSEIGEGDVDSAINAGKLLAGFAQEVPSTDLIDFLFGQTDLQAFANALPKLGSGLKSFAENTKGLTEDSVAGPKAAMGILAEFASQELPERTFGQVMAQWVTGESEAQAFANGMSAFGTGLANLYTAAKDVSNWSVISTAVTNLQTISDMVKTLNEGTWMNFQNTGDIFGSWDTSGIMDFLSGLADFGTVAYDSGAGFAQMIADGIDSVLKMVPDSFNLMGSTAVIELLNGLTPGDQAVYQMCRSIGISAVNGFHTADFYGAGVDAVAGLVSGISSNMSAVSAAGMRIGQTLLRGTRTALDSHSPSREFMSVGTDAEDGLILSIRKGLYKVAASGETMGETVLNSAAVALRHIDAVINSNLDLQPTIRPVLDTSDILAGSQQISSLFGAPYGLNPLSGINAQNLGFLAGLQDLGAYTQSSQQIVSAIHEMNDRIDMLGDRIANLQMRTDTGALVGAMEEQIDQRLGVITIRKGRGN